MTLNNVVSEQTKALIRDLNIDYRRTNESH